MVELNIELENLRLAETDPSKKGNSLFSEIEDNRKFLEQQCQTLKLNFDILNKQTDLKNQQISRLKVFFHSIF